MLGLKFDNFDDVTDPNVHELHLFYLSIPLFIIEWKNYLNVTNLKLVF